MNYWAVGATFGGIEDKSEEFVKNGYWRYVDDKSQYTEEVAQIKIDDILVIKSSFTRGEKNSITVTRLKYIGIVVGKDVANPYYFKVNWLKDVPKKDFDNISHRKIIEPLRHNVMFDYVQLILFGTEYQLQMQNYINLLQHKPQIILQGPPGTGKTRLAKLIAEEMTKKQTEGEYKIVQFHPAYSYEDFVRGIVAQTNENGQISYEVQNKILGEFAQKALQNLADSKKKPIEVTKEANLNRVFEEFKDYVIDEIVEKGKFELDKTTIYITSIDEESFLYTGNSWKNTLRMKFKDLLLMLSTEITQRNQIKEMNNIAGLAKQHASYYLRMLSKFREFQATENIPQKTFPSNKDKPVTRQNFILIIDEINRANLPAVLGELIYALEYRNENVTSIYELDGNREINLPDNLYIIGTMNTADRSVGHIDYAIRRRFAFVDILPDESVITFEKAKTLFIQLKSIFEKHTVADFNQNEVMLGHSYFIVADETQLYMRLQYEIKPILKEYLKDGILLASAEKLINELTI